MARVPQRKCLGSVKSRCMRAYTLCVCGSRPGAVVLTSNFAAAHALLVNSGSAIAACVTRYTNARTAWASILSGSRWNLSRETNGAVLLHGRTRSQNNNSYTNKDRCYQIDSDNQKGSRYESESSVMSGSLFIAVAERCYRDSLVMAAPGLRARRESGGTRATPWRA